VWHKHSQTHHLLLLLLVYQHCRSCQYTGQRQAADLGLLLTQQLLLHLLATLMPLVWPPCTSPHY
jgi:hypothetical protein